jgi:hypothetical protein
VSDVLTLIAAVAALGAVFFAWRTVIEARAAHADDERARQLSRIERLGVALSEFAAQLDAGSFTQAHNTQARAAILWVTAEAGGDEVREAVVTPISGGNAPALAEKARAGVENMLTGLEDILALAATAERPRPLTRRVRLWWWLRGLVRRP